MTPEILGNYLYGLTGCYWGFLGVVIHQGAGYAQKGTTAYLDRPDLCYGDNPEDYYWIEQAIIDSNSTPRVSIDLSGLANDSKIWDAAIGLLKQQSILFEKSRRVPVVSDTFLLFCLSFLLVVWGFDDDAEIVADKLSALIKKAVPDHLLGKWQFANQLANLPIYDAVIEYHIDKGVLTPPEDRIGAEGYWMSVEK